MLDDFVVDVDGCWVVCMYLIWDGGWCLLVVYDWFWMMLIWFCMFVRDRMLMLLQLMFIDLCVVSDFCLMLMSFGWLVVVFDLLLSDVWLELIDFEYIWMVVSWIWMLFGHVDWCSWFLLDLFLILIDFGLLLVDVDGRLLF